MADKNVEFCDPALILILLIAGLLILMLPDSQIDETGTQSRSLDIMKRVRNPLNELKLFFFYVIGRLSKK
ncbi:MAG: hypothetical protein JW795_08790 [Chitinivibrionales bacterium]|nr:hypothetical protein [Chitinivibrionales bacterium]